MSKKIKIRLEILNDHQLLYQVLEQCEGLRGNEVRIGDWDGKIYHGNHFDVYSIDVPDICEEDRRIFIRGNKKDKDLKAILLEVPDAMALKEELLSSLQEWADNGYFGGKEKKQKYSIPYSDGYKLVNNGYKVRVERWSNAVIVQILDTPKGLAHAMKGNTKPRFTPIFELSRVSISETCLPNTSSAGGLIRSIAFRSDREDLAVDWKKEFIEHFLKVDIPTIKETPEFDLEQNIYEF